MAKMYTLDKKLLVGVPEIRVGDIVITVDDREKTVKKAIKLFDEMGENTRDFDKIEEVLKLVLSKEDYKKIDGMDMPFVAYQELLSLVMSAMTGAEQEEQFRE
jgi:glyoxylate utilization-related uncharacterized protein